MHITRLLGAGAFALALGLNPLHGLVGGGPGLLPTAAAQQNPGWFVPNQAQERAPAAPRPAPSRPAARPNLPPAPPPVLAVPGPGPAGPSQQEASEPPVNAPLPPIPELAPLPRGTNPPAAVIGVLGVPEVMRASTAAQQVEKAIGERREKLNEDAQKEQASWRDLQQQITNQGNGLSVDQRRGKERELQERVTNAQRTLRDRNRVIQEAAQYSLGQIERTLIAVIRQVAESHGMNLVLHRSQVALNVNEFDITDEVAAQLNKILATVRIPPEGMTAAAFATQLQKDNPALFAPPTAPAAQTASAPGSAAPAPAPAPAPTPPAAPPANPPRR